MRNYLNELKGRGYSYSQISKETGINVKTISQFARGIKKLKSTSDYYKSIRNANRRLAYQTLKESGFTAERALKYRRIGFSEKTYTHKTSKKVKHTKIEKTMYQIKILGLFFNPKTGERREAEGVSAARARIDTESFIEYAFTDDIYEIVQDLAETSKYDYDDNQEMLMEAINSARGSLGGTNWELERIIDIEEIEYQIG